MHQRYDEARAAAHRLQDIFGKGNFFLEVQDQGLEIDRPVNRELVRLSRESGIPLVATNDCHYLTHADAARAGSAAVHSDRQDHVRPAAHALCHRSVLFQDRGGDGAGLRRTAGRAGRAPRPSPNAATCASSRCGTRFPEFKVPEGYTLDSYFERVVREGFAERVPILEALAEAGPAAAAAGGIRAAAFRTRSR